MADTSLTEPCPSPPEYSIKCSKTVTVRMPLCWDHALPDICGGYMPTGLLMLVENDSVESGCCMCSLSVLYRMDAFWPVTPAGDSAFPSVMAPLQCSGEFPGSSSFCSPFHHSLGCVCVCPMAYTYRGQRSTLGSQLSPCTVWIL